MLSYRWASMLRPAAAHLLRSTDVAHCGPENIERSSWGDLGHADQIMVGKARDALFQHCKLHQSAVRHARRHGRVGHLERAALVNKETGIHSSRDSRFRAGGGRREWGRGRGRKEAGWCGGV